MYFKNPNFVYMILNKIKEIEWVEKNIICFEFFSENVENKLSRQRNRHCHCSTVDVVLNCLKKTQSMIW